MTKKISKRRILEFIDIDVVRQLLNYFTRATGLGVLFLNDEGNELLSVGGKEFQSEFCSLVHSTRLGKKRCQEMFKKAGQEAMRWGSPYIFNCYLGLMEWAVPVAIENELIGMFICGQILIQDMDDLSYIDVIKQCRDFGLKDKSVNEALEKVKILSGEKVQAAAEMLFLISNTLVKSAHKMLEQRREILEQQSRLAEEIHLRKDMGITLLYPQEKEKELIGLVKLGDKVGAKAILNQILGNILVNNYEDLMTAKGRLLELMVLLSRSAMEAGADRKGIFKAYDNYLKDFTRINSQEKLCNWIVNCLDDFTDSIYKLRNVERITLISRGLDYIKEYCCEKITLEDVAHYVHKSPFYFSHIIKDETGLTFNDYLTKMRVEKAKELLKDSNLSIATIAIEVGYNDQSYFSKVFKYWEGISPARYRKKVL